MRGSHQAAVTYAAVDPVLEDLLAALDPLTAVDLYGCSARPVAGAFQAEVWRLSPGPGEHEFAVRLTPKPLRLVQRIGRIVDTVTAVPCARTLAVAPTAGGTAHLATWLPAAPEPAAAVGMSELGSALARLHAGFATQPDRLLDRPLRFDLTDTGEPWSLARQAWAIGARAWPDVDAAPALHRPIHGDSHSGNYLRTCSGAIGFIDFDKMMCASPIFDLARVADDQAEFDPAALADLFGSYFDPRPVPESAVTQLEGFAVLINEATGVLSRISDDAGRRRRGTERARWWLERVGDPDPMGLRAELGRRGLIAAQAG